MDEKTNNEQMNEIHLKAAKIILTAMDEVDDLEHVSLMDRADMLAKLGMTLSGLRVNPEPFDPRTIAGVLATPFGGGIAPGPDEGKGGNLA